MTPYDQFLAAGMAGELLEVLCAAQLDPPEVVEATEVAAEAARALGDDGP